MSPLAPALQAYFTDRLIGQRAASPNTIGAYKVTFRLLLAFAANRTRKAPGTLDITDLDAPLVAAFLDHLERDRRNGAATRNNRLAAIHSLFGYLALRHPEHAATVQPVLAIPPKRTQRNLLTYLTDPEADALLGACDQTTWTGRRDHAMFALTIQTGLRISELAGLSREDITLTAGANVHTVGKGRKERRTPLVPTTGGPQGLVGGASRRSRRPTVPHHHRQAPQPRCHRTAPRSPRGPRQHELPLPQGKHVTIWLGHETSLDHLRLSARRHDPQTASDQPHQAACRQTGAIPTPDPVLAFLKRL